MKKGGRSYGQEYRAKHKGAPPPGQPQEIVTRKMTPEERARMDNLPKPDKAPVGSYKQSDLESRRKKWLVFYK